MKVTAKQPRTFTPVIIELIAHTQEELIALRMLSSYNIPLASWGRWCYQELCNWQAVLGDELVNKTSDGSIEVGRNHTLDP